MFTSLARPSTLTSEVTRQMEEMIVRHAAPGSKFPSERELAISFGVSRTVVREAVSGLTSRGLLKTIPGSGTVVGTPSSEAVSRAVALFLKTGGGLDHGSVHEIRSVLEVEIAGFAAERHTEADLEQIEAVFAQMNDSGNDPAAYVELDVAFHRLLAVATQNTLFPLVLDAISDVMYAVRTLGQDVAGSFENGQAHHRNILAAVRAKDAVGARRAMLEHLDDSERIMQQALAARKSE